MLEVNVGYAENKDIVIVFRGLMNKKCLSDGAGDMYADIFSEGTHALNPRTIRNYLQCMSSVHENFSNTTLAAPAYLSRFIDAMSMAIYDEPESRTYLLNVKDVSKC